MTLIWIALVALALVLGFQAGIRFHLARLRRDGQYPRPGQATLADVERLLADGRPALAVRCFREIHGCSLRQAKEAISVMSPGASRAH